MKELYVSNVASTRLRTPRRSLTPRQLRTAQGAELLTLCQTITEDGSLTDEEVHALRQWLADNRESNLPAVEFLFATVERIISDKHISESERIDLHKAVEIVLPVDIRARFKARRRELELAKAERERPIETADFMVAGVHYEGRAGVIFQHLDPGDQVFLVRDRQNRFSRHAIEVRLANGMQIGFVPEYDAVRLSAYFDSGCLHLAFCKKVLTAGRAPIPVVIADLFSLDCGLDAVAEADVPGKVIPDNDATIYYEPYGDRERRRPSVVPLIVVLVLVIVIATVISRGW